MINYELWCWNSALRRTLLLFGKVFHDGKMLAIKRPYTSENRGEIFPQMYILGALLGFAEWSGPRGDLLGGMNTVIQFLTGIPFFCVPGPILGRKLRLQLTHIWIHTELKNLRTTGCWLLGIPGTRRPPCWTSPNLPQMTPVLWSRPWVSAHSDTPGTHGASQALLSATVGLKKKRTILVASQAVFQ